MRLRIQGSNIQLTDDLREHINRRFLFALDRMESHISQVSVRVGDVNGPRGGPDKECKVLLSLAAGGEIVVHESNSSLYGVVDRASERIKRLVAKKLDREKDWRRRAPLREKATNGNETDGEET